MDATDRIPALDGALNFRDLGGYAGVDGREVRWQVIYRSGTTHAMSPSAIACLGGRGLRYAYDLRSNRERRGHPNRLTQIANLDYRFREHERLPGDIGRLIRSGNASAADARRTMIAVYRSLPQEFADSYRALFGHLAQGHLPMAFNCTAGKDRTGAAAALLLSALGASRETVLEDYLLSQRFFEQNCRLLLGQDGDAALFGKIDPAIWQPILGVHPDYLEAMFDAIEESHGSAARYLESLGVHGAALEQLRNHLLR